MGQTHVTPFTVNSGQVPSTQTNFPVCLAPTDNRFRTVANGGHAASANFYDGRPAADEANTSPLSYEIVPGTYNATTGFFEMYVKVPSLADGSVIYLFYGDTSLTTDGSSTATWDSNFKLVAHYPNGSTLTALDSTSNANNGTVSGTSATSGKIDGAGSFNGSGNYISHGSSDIFTENGALTVTVWLNPTDSGQLNSGRIIDRGSVVLRMGATGLLLFEVPGSTPLDRATSTSSISYSTFSHVALRWDGSTTAANAHIYVNKTETSYSTTTNGVSPTNNSSATLYVGNRSDGARSFNGKIDELRISDTERAVDWISTEYNNTNNPGAFYTIESERILIFGAAISSGASTAVPTLAYSVDLPAVSSGSQGYAPVLAYSMTLPAVSSGSQGYAPQLAYEANLPAITSGSQGNAPSLSYAVSMPAVSTSEALNSPSVGLTLSLSTISTTETSTAPSLAYAVNLPAVSSGAQEYAPSLTYSVTLPFTASGAQNYSPELVYAAALPTISSGSQAFTLSVLPSVSLPAISSAESVFTPQIAMLIAMPSILSGGATYTPELPGADQAVDLSFIAGSSSVFGFDVAQGLRRAARKSDRSVDWPRSGRSVEWPRSSRTIILG